MKPAYVKYVSTTDFFTVELDFKSWKMDLFEIRVRLGVSRGHSATDKLTVWMFTPFEYKLKGGNDLILLEVIIESRSTTLK